jgi:diguanylate cyclase (GGDEF)-like protein/PAS domain S-box-containing protein
MGPDPTKSQQRGKRALQSSPSDWLELAVDAADLAVWDYDVGSGRVALTEHWARMLGLPEGPTVTSIQALTERIPADQREGVRAAIISALKSPDSVYRMEHCVLREDGASITIISYGRVIERDAHGRALRMVGTNRDVSWYVEAVQALRQSERLFKAAVESSAIGMALVSPDGRWLKVNKALCDILGYSETSLLQLTFQDITHPDDLNADLQLLQETLEGRRDTYEMEKRYVHRDGHEVWTQLNVALVRDAHNRPVQFISQIQDITHRKEILQSLRDSEERFRNALHYSPIGMAMVGLDGRFLTINRALCNILGYSEDELLAISFPAITHPDDLPMDLAFAEELVSGKRDTYQMEKRYVRKDGSIVWIQLNGSVVRDAQAHPLHFIAQIQDVSERRRNQQALVESEQRLELALAGANLGTWDWDISTGRVVFNRRWAEMLGYTLSEIEPNVHSWEKLVHPEDIPRVKQILNAHLLGETPFYETEHRMRAKHGEWVWILDRGRVVERAPGGKPLRASGTHMDITEMRAAQRRAEFLAFHDELTQLPNQRLLLDRMEVALATARRRGWGLAVMFVDLDGFKPVNDTYGHAAGDAVLRTIAARIGAAVRRSDTVARVGGDEFVIVMPDSASPEGEAILARRVIEEIAKPIDAGNGICVSVAASVGIARYPEHGGNAQTLLKCADEAMYRAKHAGGNCFRSHDLEENS